MRVEEKKVEWVEKVISVTEINTPEELVKYLTKHRTIEAGKLTISLDKNIFYTSGFPCTIDDKLFTIILSVNDKNMIFTCDYSPKEIKDFDKWLHKVAEVCLYIYNNNIFGE